MAADFQDAPSFTPRRRWVVGCDMLVRTLVVFAVVVMVNYLSEKLFHRQYLSEHTRTELSPRTVNFVRSLTNDVKVTLYYDREDDLFSTLSSLAREYHTLNPRIRIAVVDYLRDAAEATKVKLTYKLPEMQKDEEKNFIIFDTGQTPRIFNGNLLADYEIEVDQEQGKYDKRATAFKGEMLFNSGLLAVTSPRKLKAYVLQGHGEHNLDSGDEVNGFLGFRSVLEQNYIEATPLKLTNGVPQDCNLLIIAGPQSAMTEAGLESIARYLDEGGRLFALFNAGNTDRKSGLERVLYGRWNVLVSETSIQDTKNSRDQAAVPVGAFSDHPAVKPLQNLHNLILVMPRPVFPVKPHENSSADAPKVMVLFTSERTATVINHPRIAPTNYPLAVAVERAAVSGVVTGRGTTRMIVVGDSFFLANAAIKLVANRDFADYAVNWLTERTQLMEGVGPRPVAVHRINVTPPQLKTIQWLLLGALPGGILLFGGLVWLRRLK